MESSPTAHDGSVRTTWWFGSGVGAMVALLRSARAAVVTALIRTLDDDLRAGSGPGRRLASGWLTATDVRRAALDRRAQVLRTRAARAGRTRAVDIDVTGTWWACGGSTYRFDQYGDRVVFEERDGHDVLACGDGLVSGAELWVRIESADGSEGEAWLRFGADHLFGDCLDHESGRADVVSLCRRDR